MEKPRIIAFVDDDPDDLELLTEAFLHEDNTLDIRVFTSGRQLFNAICSYHRSDYPHLFIVDYNMPEQSGAEIIEVLCQNNLLKQVPKVILSTSDSHFYQKICKEKGADYYFKKPNSFDQWVNMAGEMLKVIRERSSS
ncbi:MAG TPA: response regulator [Chitinophagaceae bacterium]|nr:response regulator [Chitinophagaceae bacterium]